MKKKYKPIILRLILLATMSKIMGEGWSTEERNTSATYQDVKK
jgi:hypothetical protein